MTKDILRLPCPCCGKGVEIDVRARSIRAIDPQDARETKNLDELVAEQKRAAQRMGDLFDSAQGEEARRAQQLDELFRSAKRKSRGDTSKPRNPFDLE